MTRPTTPEAAAAEREPARADAAAADVGDLAGVERSVAPETHEGSLTAQGANATCLRESQRHHA